MNSIDIAISLFSGFTQKRGDTNHIGFVKLLRELQLLCKQWPTVEVSLYPWNADVEDIAEYLWKLRPNHGKKQVHVVGGYSYGGDRAVKFCWELGSRNDVAVASLGLCDPVCRWDWFPGILAATGTGKIRVPSVVESAWSYRQTNPRWALGRGLDVFQPAGHDVVVVNTMATNVVEPVIVNETHSYIDNNASFQEAFVDTVKETVKQVITKKRKVKTKES